MLNAPEGGPRNPSRFCIDHLTPVARRVLRMPAVKPHWSFFDSFLPSLLVVPVDGKPEMSTKGKEARGGFL